MRDLPRFRSTLTHSGGAASEEAGLSGISPHRAFRASPITLAILQGSSMPEVMKRARHKSAQTTTMYFDEVAANQVAVSRSVCG